MIKLKNILLAFGISMVLGGSLFAITTPSNAVAFTADTKFDVAKCAQSFLTFPTWFRGLVQVQETRKSPVTYECVIQSPDQVGGLGPFITHIVLNIVEMGLQIVGYLTAGFILWGGFMFLMSQGTPDEAAKARKTITNAVIGLVISIVAIGAVNLLSGILIHNP